MLSKQNRVNKHLFSDVIKKGVSYYTQNISLKITNTTNTKPKFAVSVPKKEVKTAVKRNLLKRRIFSILEKTAMKTKLGFASVFFLKKELSAFPTLNYMMRLSICLKRQRLFFLGKIFYLFFFNF